MEVVSKNIWIVNHYASTPFHGPGERHFRFAKELIKKGHNVYVFASANTHIHKTPPILKKSYKIESVDGVNFVWIRSNNYSGHGFKRLLNMILFSVNFFVVSLKKLKIANPDVVWVSSPQPFVVPFAYLISWLKKSQFWYEIRDIWPLTIYELNGNSKWNPILFLMQKIENFAIRKSNKIVSPLENLGLYIQERGYQKNVNYIPNGVDYNELVSLKPQEMKKFQIPEGKLYYIGYAGTFSISNGVEYLLKAANLLKKHKYIHFVLIGDGVDYIKYRQYAEINNLSNITFTGRLQRSIALGLIKNLNILYKGAPNCNLYKYGIGAIKIPEYMSLRKFIINSTNSKINAITKYDCGFNVPAEDERAIAEIILKITKLENSSLENLADNAENAVKANYTFEAIGDKIQLMLSDNFKN